MRRIFVSYDGQIINAGYIIEKMRDAIEKTGINVDDLGEYEALTVAANVAGKTVPELLGI